MKTSIIKPLIYFSFILSIAVAIGCTPARYVPAEHGFYSTGYPGAAFSFEQDLSFFAAGRVKGLAPSDAMPNPPVSGVFAVYGDNGKGMVTKHAHTIYATLPSKMWEWAMESWAPPYAISDSKNNIAGKDWTIRILPVPSLKDWFSELWLANGREVPRFWLAKRWSATSTLGDIRILAEYREPAPECMTEALVPLEQIANREEVSPPEGFNLRTLCSREIDSFNARANAAVSLEQLPQDLPAPAQGQAAFLPQSSMNIGKMIGEVHQRDRGDRRIMD